MPHARVPKDKKTESKEIKPKTTEKDEADGFFQWTGKDDTGFLQPDEGGASSVCPEAGNHADRLLSFIDAARLQEAQEFRRKGYNRQVPEVDPKLVTQLREAVAAVKSRTGLQSRIEGPLGSLWLLEQLRQIERYTDRLSDSCIQDWVNHEVASENNGTAGDNSLGSRRTAQSLVRRLEAILQTLIQVVHTLRAVDDHSTPEKRLRVLVTELTDALSSGDDNTVMQALERVTTEPAGHAAWSALVQARDAAWEAGKPDFFRAITEITRHEAEKSNMEARKLEEGAAQTFFSDMAAWLQSLSSDLAKASVNVSQSASARIMQKVNDDVAAPVSRTGSLRHRFRAGLAQKKLELHAVVAGGKVHTHRLARILRHGHPTETSSKEQEQLIADSIVRSILWQWQQPAIKIQYASGVLLAKVDELQKIEEILSSHSVVDGGNAEQNVRDTPAGNPGENDIDALVRWWVNDSFEQEKPENQLAAKVTVLEQLLDGDISHARTILAHLGDTPESIQEGLKRQWFSVNAMQKSLCFDVGCSLSVTVEMLLDTFMPDIAGEITIAASALNDALLAAGKSSRNFSAARAQAKKAQLLAVTIKEKISAESARLTESPLDEHSRGARLAKHWASLAREQSLSNYPPLNAKQVFSSLKKWGLSEGVLSGRDPEGYLFATRLAGELENACNDELILPMSPEQYAALEKGLVEYFVKWGQRRVSRGVVRMIIELSFEQALDGVTFKLSSLVRVPYKILKASVKIPYKVNKVNNYVMPGQDKPYKAIYGLLEKKLKQLGFSLVMSPVPGVFKLAAGAAMTAGAAAYNHHIENRENTFSAVYGRVAEGKKSEKINMSSPKGMLFDAVLDATSMAAVKGIRRTWQSERNEFDVFFDKKFLSETDEEIQSQALWDKEEIKTPHGVTLILRGDRTFRIAVRKHVEELQQHKSGREILGKLAGKSIEIRPPHPDDWLRTEDDGRHYFNSRVVGESIFFDPYNNYYGVSRNVDAETWRDVDPSIVLFHELLHISTGDSQHDGIVTSDPTRLEENDYRKEFYESRGLSVVKRHLSEDECADNEYIPRPRQNPGSATDSATPASEQYYYDSSIRYQDLTDEQKKQTYFYAIKYLLKQIENDSRFSQPVRERARLARLGAKILVPVDINGHKLNNTFLLPHVNGAKYGVLICLDSETPYYYVSTGKDLSADVKLSMPYGSDRKKARHVITAFRSPDIIYEDSGKDVLEKVRSGKLSFDNYFNHNNPAAVSITSLSEELKNTIEADYTLQKRIPENKQLIFRAIKGAHIPDPGVSVTEAKYELQVSWADLTPADYLRSFARPFSTVSGQIQLVSSGIQGDTVQDTELKVSKAEYIGSWVDATAGAVISFTPPGWLLGTAQSVADITADVADGKKPDGLAVAGLIVGSIPGGKIAAKVGKFSRVGGKAVKYGVMLGNTVVNLASVGESIKTAVETGEPLAIYQALLASGLSVKDSYDMAKSMSSELKLGRTMEDSASLEQLEALQKNSLSPVMPVRTFRVGSTVLRGRVNNGEIEISRDYGVTWVKGSKLHLLAYRLQNAGGGRGLPGLPRSEIAIGRHTFKRIIHNEEKLSEMRRIAGTYTPGPKNTWRKAKLQREYQAGKRMSYAPQYDHYNNLSAEEKIDLFINDDTDAITRGVLYGKLDEHIRNIDLFKMAEEADNWNTSADKASDVVLAPQNVYLRGKPGQSLPASILMGRALQSRQGKRLAKKLMGIRSSPDVSSSPLYKSLTALHEGDNSSKFSAAAISDVNMNTLFDAELNLFPTENSSVRVDIPGHTMLISKVYEGGEIKYVFYDPNYGMAYFKKYKDMIDFFKKKIGDYGVLEESTKFYSLDYSRLEKIKIRGVNLDEMINGGIPQSYRANLVSVSLSGITPDNGIYRKQGWHLRPGKTYIKVGDNVYPVEWNITTKMWEIFSFNGENVPVKIDADGEWFRYEDTGVKDDGDDKKPAVKQGEHDTQPETSEAGQQQDIGTPSSETKRTSIQDGLSRRTSVEIAEDSRINSPAGLDIKLDLKLNEQWSLSKVNIKNSNSNNERNVGSAISVIFTFKYNNNPSKKKFTKLPWLQWHEKIKRKTNADVWEFEHDMYALNPKSPTFFSWRNRYTEAYHYAMATDKNSFSGPVKIFDKEGKPLTPKSIGKTNNKEKMKSNIKKYMAKNGGIMEVTVIDFPSVFKKEELKINDRTIHFNIGFDSENRITFNQEISVGSNGNADVVVTVSDHINNIPDPVNTKAPENVSRFRDDTLSAGESN